MHVDVGNEATTIFHAASTGVQEKIIVNTPATVYATTKPVQVNANILNVLSGERRR